MSAVVVRGLLQLGWVPWQEPLSVKDSSREAGDNLIPLIASPPSAAVSGHLAFETCFMPSPPTLSGRLVGCAVGLFRPLGVAYPGSAGRYFAEASACGTRSQ
jgi:hypothetical protein